ncbi:MAG: hypothetical protein LIP02_04045 [Bacteroidales bacterium]|nr:hypothetical protein [Bacteroidales bacterium]
MDGDGGLPRKWVNDRVRAQKERDRQLQERFSPALSNPAALSSIIANVHKHDGKRFTAQGLRGKVQINMDYKRNEHLARDISLGRGGFRYTDVDNLPYILSQTKEVGREVNHSGKSSKKPYDNYLIFQGTLRNRTYYLKVGEELVRTGGGKGRSQKWTSKYTAYSISDNWTSDKEKEQRKTAP